jgi:hypothetical protein
MKAIRVGRSRLYSVMAAADSLINRHDEALLRFRFGSIDVEAYLGPDPRHAVLTFKLDPPIPKDPKAPPCTSRRRGSEWPPPGEFPADFYTELVATETIEVDDAIAAAFQGRDKAASAEMSRRANEREPLLTAALDYVAGIVGLRLHSLLVTTPVIEQHYAYRDKGVPYEVNTLLKLKTTEAYDWGVSDKGLTASKSRMPEIQIGWTWEKAAEVLAWLLRAWSAEDPVLEFVSSFIPLECVIPELPITAGNSWDLRRRAVLAIVRKDAAAQDRDDLLEFVRSLQPQPPTLVSRFQKWAAGAALPGWRRDVTAFRRFCRMRNLLVHAGKKGLEPRVTVGADEVRTLEDIAERYVSLALFGDANVYQRPERCRSAGIGEESPTTTSD